MALIQNPSLGGGSSNAFVLPLTQAVTSGDFLLVNLFWKSSLQTLAATPMTDNTGGGSLTWTQNGSTLTWGNYSLAQYYVQNCGVGSSAATSVTAHFTAGGGDVALWLAEESGIVTSGSPFDTTALYTRINQPAVTSFSSGAMANSTQATLVLYGMAVSNTSANVAFAPSGSWVQLGVHTPITGDGDDTMMMRQAVIVTGAYAATGTCTSASVSTSVVALRPIASPSSGGSGGGGMDGGLNGGFQ